LLIVRGADHRLRGFYNVCATALDRPPKAGGSTHFALQVHG